MFSVFKLVLTDKSNLSGPWTKKGDIAGWLSRSAWSLARIALWRINENNSANINVWLPDYFCNDSLAPLRCLGVKLLFYPINSEMEPNFRFLRKLAKDYPPDLFIIVHYFGNPSKTKYAYDFCSNNNTWMIEDAAHILRPTTETGKGGDFVLYSPHKLLPIPDGALLVVKPNGPNKFGENSLSKFGEPENWDKELYINRKWPSVSIQAHTRFNGTWIIKRLLQKLGIRGWKKKIKFLEIKKSYVKSGLVTIPEPAMSSFSFKILQSVIPDLDKVAHLRRLNEFNWDKNIERLISDGPKIIFANKTNGNLELTPYIVPIIVKKESGQLLLEKLQNSGIPAMTWPDLPPEVYSNGDIHLCALNLRLSRIFLPCHQTLSQS